MKKQTKKILSLTRRGWVSPMAALREAGCMRLGARIYELREMGHEFETRWRRLRNGKLVKEFRLRKSVSA